MNPLPKLDPKIFGFDQEEIGYSSPDGSYQDCLYIAAPNITWGFAHGKIRDSNVEEVFKNWDKNNRILYLYNGGQPLYHLVDYSKLPIPSLKVKNVASKYFDIWFNEGIMGFQAIINAPAVYKLIGKFLGEKNSNIKRRFYNTWEEAIDDLNISSMIEFSQHTDNTRTSLPTPPSIFVEESKFMGNLIPFPPGCYTGTNGIGKVFIYQIRKGLFYTFSFGELSFQDFQKYIQAQKQIALQNPDQKLYLINNSLHLLNSDFKSRKLMSDFASSPEYPFEKVAVVINGLSLIALKVIRSFNTVLKERIILFESIHDAWDYFNEHKAVSNKNEIVFQGKTLEDQLDYAKNYIEKLEQQRAQNIETITHVLGAVTWENLGYQSDFPTNLDSNPYREIYDAISLVQQDIKEIMNDRDRYLQKVQVEKEKAEKAANIKSDFLSTMSHEIRTPLNAVIGLSEILLDENTDPEQHDNLETLSHSGKTLLTLINDILDFSRIESGKLELENHSFPLDSTIQNIVRPFYPIATAKAIDLNLHISDQLSDIVLNSDSARLSQILNNLIGNAIKFTEEGFVNIVVRQISRSNNLIKLNFSILDSGIGIPPNKISTIWEEFTQINQSDNRKYGGSGLGLAITKKLIEAFHGSVSVESEIGTGTQFVFEITFPYQTQKLNPTQVSSDSRTELKGLHILVVDDNKINLKVANKHLAKFDCETTLALSGNQALELCQKQKFDIILMDLQMPEMDGFETTEKIHAIDHSAKIIALTADVFPETKERVLDSTMISYLTKPIRSADLYSCLVQVKSL